MTRVYTKDLEQYIGSTVTLKGWLHNIRIQKTILFIEFRDVTGIVQCVLEKVASPKMFKEIAKLPQESIIKLVGTPKEFEKKVELTITEFEIITIPEDTLPIPVDQKGDSETGLKKRLDNRWLDLRKPKKKLIFEISTYMEMIMREYLFERNFISAMTPKIMATPFADTYREDHLLPFGMLLNLQHWTSSFHSLIRLKMY